MLDRPSPVRAGEEINLPKLSGYLRGALAGFQSIQQLAQFPGGFSNLTYLLTSNQGEWVLRRPPRGANIKTAHDMQREFSVLQKLQGIYGRIPVPIHYCADPEIIGAPFYLMERVEGIILRPALAKELSLPSATMHAISAAAVDNLSLLHQIDIDATGLREIGRPEGYVERQVSGWIRRYQRAQTDDIPAMDELAEWMTNHLPPDGCPGLIHNDYKYDNLVLDPDEPSRILAVLDWEMATVGDTRMGLGTSLAYWSEATDARRNPLAASNLTWLPGNLTRTEVVDRYQHNTDHDLTDILFYFTYGAFKIGVIVQQIYARWRAGHSRDPRFAGLIEAVRYFGDLGRHALERDRISGLHT
ncbi:MAG: phosphotransferase family protein [Lewinella sp.]|nr:phosphotransferase family protein [Lewinella sp.]